MSSNQLHLFQYSCAEKLCEMMLVCGRIGSGSVICDMDIWRVSDTKHQTTRLELIYKMASPLRLNQWKQGSRFISFC